MTFYRCCLLLWLCAAPTLYANGRAVGQQCVDCSLAAVEDHALGPRSSDANLFEVSLWEMANSDRSLTALTASQMHEIKTFLFFYARELLLRSTAGIEESAVAIRRVVLAMPGACVWDRSFCDVFRTQQFETAKVGVTKTLFVRPSDKVISAKYLAQKVFSLGFLKRSEGSFRSAQQFVPQSLTVTQTRVDGLADKVFRLSQGVVDDARRDLSALKAAPAADKSGGLAARLTDAVRVHFSLDAAAAQQLGKSFSKKDAATLNQLLDLWLFKLNDAKAIASFKGELTHHFDNLHSAKLKQEPGSHATLMPLVLSDPKVGLTHLLNEDLSSYIALMSGAGPASKKEFKLKMILGFVIFSEDDQGTAFHVQLRRNSYVRWAFLQALKEVENKQS